uniref:IGFBP N-terminal domain-containing protein n=1 Tax=Octopus bimaculoides TaxID=37653 RepID=A0A0L8GHE0_OCTBM
MKYIFFIALSVVAASAYVCPPNVCSIVTCGTVENCADGEIGKGYCGCCDICIKYLKEGDLCILEGLLEMPAITKCGHNLVCNEHTRTCTSK